MVPRRDAKAEVIKSSSAIRCRENSAFGDESCIITDCSEVDDFPSVVSEIRSHFKTNFEKKFSEAPKTVRDLLGGRQYVAATRPTCSDFQAHNK